MTVIDVGFLALQKEIPLIDDFKRLNATHINRVFDKLCLTLENRFLHHLNILHQVKVKSKPPQFHTSKENIKTSLDGLEQVISAYLYIRVSSPFDVLAAAKAQPTRLRMAGAVQSRTLVSALIGPSFADVIQKPFDRLVANDIDRAEAQIDGIARLDTIADVELIDPPRFEEYLAWRKLIRLRIVVCLVNSLNYDRLFHELDGDAAWFLSERIELLVSHIVELDLYQKFEKEVYGSETFLSGLGLTSMLNKIAGLRQVSKSAAMWRSWCKFKGCSVQEIGNQHPWIFQPLSPDLFTLDGIPMIPHPPHMFTRKVAETRASLVKDRWGFARFQIPESEDDEIQISNEKKFQFLVTAATLQHGGKHPPHKTHRDGSMFDMILTDLPVLISLFTNDEEPKFGKTIKLPLETPEDEEEGTSTVALPADPVLEIASEEKQKEFRKIAKKFTQCIYLTFPSSVIYGSRSILQEAKDELIDRLKNLIDETSDSEKKERLEKIQTLILLRDRKGRELVLRPIIKADHRDHWHVNYNPDYLGDESEGNKSAEPGIARQIKAVLQAVSEDNLWQEILE